MRALLTAMMTITMLVGDVMAGEVKPLEVLTWYDFAGLTDAEKDTYVTGVLEAQSFMLYGASHPDLEMFVTCVETEGVTKIRQAAETIISIYPEEMKWPIPWAVSKALGTVCADYR